MFVQPQHKINHRDCLFFLKDSYAAFLFEKSTPGLQFKPYTKKVQEIKASKVNMNKMTDDYNADRSDITFLLNQCIPWPINDTGQFQKRHTSFIFKVQGH